MPPKVPATVISPSLYRFGFWQKLADGWFPVGEEFSAMVKTISDSFYMYGSAPVIAVMDAISMLHAASITRNDNLLLDARKRHLLAVNTLRLHSGQAKSKLTSAELMIIAQGVLACQVGHCLLEVLQKLCFCTTCFSHTARIPEVQSLIPWTKMYSAISLETEASAWLKHVVGMWALIVGRARSMSDLALEAA
jgi:hypothetical protein